MNSLKEKNNMSILNQWNGVPLGLQKVSMNLPIIINPAATINQILYDSTINTHPAIFLHRRFKKVSVLYNIATATNPAFTFTLYDKDGNLLFTNTSSWGTSTTTEVTWKTFTFNSSIGGDFVRAYLYGPTNSVGELTFYGVIFHDD